MYRIVEFPSEGATLRGRLYLRADSTRPAPIIIMAHGFSATITGMTADRYAEVLHDAGFAVLLYDHRNFGLSGGEPRQQIDCWVQARGYRDAIDYVTSLSGIDPARVALWGDSMSAAVAIVVGALDKRARTVVAQVPACGNEPPAPDPDESRFESMRRRVLDGALVSADRSALGPLPVVSFDQLGSPSLLTPLTAFRWFIEYGGRPGTTWQNWATLVRSTAPAQWQPVLCAAHLHGPALFIIASEDEMPGCRTQVSRLAASLAPTGTELVEIDGGHFGLLHHPSPLFDQVSRVQRDFLLRQLA
jgi:pimeloyl-ACP methyl ester carboxylesterase